MTASLLLVSLGAFLEQLVSTKQWLYEADAGRLAQILLQMVPLYDSSAVDLVVATPAQLVIAVERHSVEWANGVSPADYAIRETLLGVSGMGNGITCWYAASGLVSVEPPTRLVQWADTLATGFSHPRQTLLRSTFFVRAKSTAGPFSSRRPSPPPYIATYPTLSLPYSRHPSIASRVIAAL